MLNHETLITSAKHSTDVYYSEVSSQFLELLEHCIILVNLSSTASLCPCSRGGVQKDQLNPCLCIVMVECVQLVFSSWKEEEEATLGLTVATAAMSQAGVWEERASFTLPLCPPLYQSPTFKPKHFPQHPGFKTGVCPLNQPTTLEWSHGKLELRAHVLVMCCIPSGCVLILKVEYNQLLKRRANRCPATFPFQTSPKNHFGSPKNISVYNS